jgi:putative membrane protein
MFIARYGPGMMDGRFTHFGGLLFCLIGIALAVLLIVLVIKTMRHYSHSGSHNSCCGGSDNSLNNSGKALEILNERYAKGEIDDEEYIKKKTELQK